MSTMPSALWSAEWRSQVVAVFSTGEDCLLPLDSATSLLSPDERERAGRFRFQADRDRWIRCRGLLRLSLGQHLQAEPESLLFTAGPHGKPFLADDPDCHFNLSHSAGTAAIAIGGVPVGIDIEQMKDDLPFASLAAHAFRPPEAAAIAADPAPQLLFYRLWTAKEAVMKCTGLGMSLAPSSIAINFDSGLPESAVREDSGERFELFARQLGSALVCACVAQ